jgi:hypothetical protein
MEAAKQLEIPETVEVPELQARLAFLATRCWQDTQRSDGPLAQDLSQRMGNIVDEFDTLFGE